MTKKFFLLIHHRHFVWLNEPLDLEYSLPLQRWTVLIHSFLQQEIEIYYDKLHRLIHLY